MASVRCLDDAFGFTGFGSGAAEIPTQARIVRNLIEGADLVMSHILHFYHLAAVDYIDTTSTAISGLSPWYPKDNIADMVGSTSNGLTALANTLVGQYVEALNIRREAHRFGAYLSGKQPCQPVLIPGGVTKTVADLSTLKTNLNATWAPITGFIHGTYVPAVCTVARAFSSTLLVGTDADGVGAGCKKYLAYGTFPTNDAGSMLISGGFLNATAAAVSGWSYSALDVDKIEEHIGYSYYNQGFGDAYDKQNPSAGVTVPQYGKADAYSWLKAPRYDTAAHVCEVGPLARVLVNVVAEGGSGTWTGAVTALLGMLDLNASHIPALRSVIGRHGARALECMVVADQMNTWINDLATAANSGETYKHRNIPKSATGHGLTEAPRGALGHWIKIDGKKISNYQCVVPSTWNLSPRDSNGVMGPVETAINGCTITQGASGDPDATGRIKIGRIVRSFDPCIACAVHVVSPDKKTVTKFEICQ